MFLLVDSIKATLGDPHLKIPLVSSDWLSFTNTRTELLVGGTSVLTARAVCLRGSYCGYSHSLRFKSRQKRSEIEHLEQFDGLTGITHILILIH